jgi:hypothetical protein
MSEKDERTISVPLSKQRTLHGWTVRLLADHGDFKQGDSLSEYSKDMHNARFRFAPSPNVAFDTEQEAASVSALLLQSNIRTEVVKLG